MRRSGVEHRDDDDDDDDDDWRGLSRTQMFVCVELQNGFSLNFMPGKSLKFVNTFRFLLNQTTVGLNVWKKAVETHETHSVCSALPLCLALFVISKQKQIVRPFAVLPFGAANPHSGSWVLRGFCVIVK
jgi:hypothetical protein